jgi:hypothetical protein
MIDVALDNEVALCVCVSVCCGYVFVAVCGCVRACERACVRA